MSIRSGIVAQKVGMTHFYSDDGEHIPTTVLKLDGGEVIAVRQKDNGVKSLQVSYGAEVQAKNVNKPQVSVFQKNKLPLRPGVAEFTVSENAALDVGKKISVSHFVAGQFVDVSGTSIGKGFAGGMKRHNFGGLEATHGVSISHRSHGSTGQCQDPGKVFKGKKMAGHMGAEKVTRQNVEVITVDEENNLIFVKGSVPGAKGGYLRVTDAVKKARPASVPFPAGLCSSTSKEENATEEVVNEA